MRLNFTFSKRIFSAFFVTLFVLAASAQAPDGYYKDADGKKAAELKTAMFNIIKDHTMRTYNDLWTDFQKTDMRADGLVWDMYSNASNFKWGKENGGNQDTGSGGTTEGDKYNREHSFPNSWFGGSKTKDKHPAYSDLFHMYPTDKLVNNKRGNNPFGDVAKPTYSSENGFSKLGPCTSEGYSGTAFEPADEYKGDFARTYFYMATRYESDFASWAEYSDSKAMLSGDAYPGYKEWAIKVLLRWAKEDPVSEKETNRNNAVYGIQKNRNPYIDYPGLEQYVWGNCKDRAFSFDKYVEPGSTGISNVTMTAPIDNVAYNLAGQRVSSTMKGIVIINGKKFIQR